LDDSVKTFFDVLADRFAGRYLTLQVFAKELQINAGGSHVGLRWRVWDRFSSCRFLTMTYNGVAVSALFDNDVKDRVRSSVDIVDLISRGAEVRRKGQSFVTLCPWHQDRDPSLTINRNRQTWKCWVCDIGGDIFSWVMQREGVTFPEALRMLAEIAGIELQPFKPNRAGQSNTSSQPSAADKKSLFETADWVVRAYHEHLMRSDDAAEARDYLLGRGITEESLQRFQVGYAPDAWNWLMDKAAAQSISINQLKSVDAIAQSERGSNYDRFRGRVIFPIRDPQGRPIAMGGRIMPKAAEAAEASGKRAAKYVNSTETRLYSKSHQLYGLDLARASIQRAQQVIVVEGYTDVIMAHQFGIENAVAVCGTALGETHIRLLRRYCDSVVLLLDGDEAGQRRTNEILELFVAAEMDLRILTLPDQLDPCDYLLANGADALRGELAKSLDALEHKIRQSCSGFDPMLDTHRASKSIDEILGLIAKAPNRPALGDTNQLRHQQILTRLSRQFGLDVEQIRQRLKTIRRQSADRHRRFSNVEFESDSTRPNQSPLTGQAARVDYRFSDLTPFDQEILEICIDDPDLVGVVIEKISESQLGSPAARALLEVYERLDLNGDDVDFHSLMSVVEDPALKSVLVSIQDRVDQKTKHTRLDSAQRLDSLFHPMERAEREQLMRRMESSTLNDQEELDLLQQVIAKVRSQ
jgi:DNA primase